MRSRTVLGSVVALAVALALAVVPAAGSTRARDAAQPSDHQVTGASAKAMTKLVFLVRDCDACTIGVQRALDPGSVARPKKPKYWNGPSGTVHGGRLVLMVPTRYTSGMTFTIYAPWEDDITDADTNIVVGYPGLPAGTTVSKHRARSATSATACWAGTTRTTTRLHVRVAKVHGKILVGGRGVTPLAWLSPTKGKLPGTTSPTWKGTLGNQDAYYC